MNLKDLMLYGSLLAVFVFTGCVADIWEKYETPYYGRERAEQICHPYSHCSQGVWVANDQVLGDKNETYAMCTEDVLRRENGWSKDTVSLGLEINRCMVASGYTLMQE